VQAVATGRDSGCDSGTNPGVEDVATAGQRLVASVTTGRLQDAVGALKNILLVVPEIFGLPLQAVKFTLTLS
jgi:hypothetical protein